MGGPIMVPPVEHKGVRYEALHWGKERDLGQNGGFIAAYDADSSEELWVARVYEIVYGDKSPQKYDRFIVEMELAEDGKALIVTDDRGGQYRFDIASRETEPLNAEAEPEVKPKKSFLQRLFGN